MAALATAAASEMRTVECSDGAALRVECWGAADAPHTLVLVHGWSGSRRSFALNAGPLAAAAGGALRVVAYDQRFHGDSSKPAWGWHVARLAMDLREVLDALGVRGATCVGTSMGVAVLLSYTELFGADCGRVGRLVFVDQAPLQNRAPGWELGSKGCYDDASLEGLRGALRAGMKAFAAGNVEACASLPLPEALLAALEEDTCKCDPEHLGELMADHTRLDWRPLLPRVRAPVLNLCGGRSGIFPVEGVAAVGRGVSDGVNVTFGEANHWLYMEEPDKFNDMVLAFCLRGERPQDGAVV